MKKLIKNINKCFELTIVELESRITKNRAETEKFKKCSGIDYRRVVRLAQELEVQGKLSANQKREFAIMGIPTNLGSDK